MRRRDLFALVAGMAAAWPLVARAQQKSMPIIGLLSSVSPPRNLDNLIQGPIHQGLAETGYVDGQNMAFEYRWAEGHYDRLPALAADLASRKVDVIVAASGGPFSNSGKKRNLNDTDRLHRRRRRSRNRPCRRSRPPGR
jgi:putative ABC transport system substrate-binding protein